MTRTIHDMTNPEAMQMLVDAAGPGQKIQWGVVTATARRLAGPDPRPIVEALRNIIPRFHRCIIHAGSDPEMADIAVAEARAALDAWEKSQ